MTDFQCLPIPTETAMRFRNTGVDDRGNAIRRLTADRDGGFPCRHCLRFAQPGETLMLGSYDLPRPRGVYWTPSPIFVHAEPCKPYAAVNDIAPILRSASSLLSIRAYDTEDQGLYDLGQACAGGDVEEPLRVALDDHRTAGGNIHTAKPGCLLCRVEPLR